MARHLANNGLAARSARSPLVACVSVLGGRCGCDPHTWVWRGVATCKQYWCVRVCECPKRCPPPLVRPRRPVPGADVQLHYSRVRPWSPNYRRGGRRQYLGAGRILRNHHRGRQARYLLYALPGRPVDAGRSAVGNSGGQHSYPYCPKPITSTVENDGSHSRRVGTALADRKTRSAPAAHRPRGAWQRSGRHFRDPPKSRFAGGLPDNR